MNIYSPALNSVSIEGVRNFTYVGMIGQSYIEWFQQFQKVLLPQAVALLLAALFVFFVLILFLELTTAFFHHRQAKYQEKNNQFWKSMVTAYLSGIRDLTVEDISRRDRRFYRDILLDVYSSGVTLSDKDKIQDLYVNLGFYQEDRNMLKKHSWWKKVQTIERLEYLEMVRAHDVVFPLLTNKQREVKFAALKMLAATSSIRLYKALPQLFREGNRWEYRYKVNMLFMAMIPAIYLKSLAKSEDKDMRKAAAILLGKWANLAGVPILKELAFDDRKEVRLEAVLALGRIGDYYQVIPILSRKVKNEHPQVRAAVAKSLGGLRNPDAIPLLEELANDSDSEVRINAFFALNRFGKLGQESISKYKDKYPEMTEKFLSEKEGQKYARSTA